ncbi:hypothetical protein E2C01_027086 [Portunus trituberculatus]|uniref:Uncharacterized protein n=1 Tax=Portunus trituberculatus TaxID=210409 RepID=A0A5B7EKF4_PORTR|nr:hypothetical protein [Portunus trituberculatus]
MSLLRQVLHQPSESLPPRAPEARGGPGGHVRSVRPRVHQSADALRTHQSPRSQVKAIAFRGPPAERRPAPAQAAPASRASPIPRGPWPRCLRQAAVRVTRGPAGLDTGHWTLDTGQRRNRGQGSLQY